MATWASNGLPTGAGSVQALHDQVATVDDDIITLPTGTFIWNVHVTITKGVTIQGNTTVTITPDIGIPTSASFVDNTTITEGLPTSNDSPFVVNTTSPKNYRITGITFTSNGSGAIHSNGGVIRFQGDSSNVRFDHNHIFGCRADTLIGVFGPIFGVMDHNYFNNFDRQSEIADIRMANYNGGTNGHGAYAEIAGYGGPKFWYIESNWDFFTTSGPPPYWGHGGGGGVNASNGGKYVFRYNRLANGTTLGHGTAQSGNSTRGTRAIDVYKNNWSLDNGGSLDGATSGSCLYHENNFTNIAPTHFSLQVYRAFYSFGTPYFGADGASAYDVNDTSDHSGNGIGGGPNGLYASGSIATAGGNTFTVSGTPWTTNQWIGYQVRTPVNGQMGLITSNSNNTINYFTWLPITFAAGQTYNIRKVVTILDQPGRGKGDLLVGDNALPAAWPNQLQEPCYSWNNTHSPSGVNVNYAPGNGNTILQNRDFFNDTPMPGYAEYTYPHPLVGGVAPTKIIVLTGPGLAFGDVVIGSVSPTAILNVANIGNTLLTVTAVSYPTGFTGNTTGFTVAPGSSFDIVVTFTPLIVQLYSGNITVTSDATSGTSIIACSGTGVAPPPPGVHGHRKQARDAFQF